MTQSNLPRLVKHLRRVTNPADSTVSDKALLTRYLEDQDEEAFTLLVRRHGRFVLSACKHVLKDPADIDDAFQATFLVLIRKAKTVNWQDSIGSWLYAVAHRVAVEAFSQAKRRKVREGNSRQICPEEPDLSWREATALLHEELNQLPDTQRLPLMLCYLEGLSRDEAAKQLGWSFDTFRGRLERARKALARRLGKRGITLSAGLLAVLQGNSTTLGGPGSVLIQQTLQAVQGTIPSSVAALVHGVSPMVFLGKKTIVSLVLVIGLIGMGFGFRYAEMNAQEKKKEVVASEPVAKKLTAEIVLSGTVLGPDGQPLEGVILQTTKQNKSDEKPTIVQLTKTNQAGQFTAKLQPLPSGEGELRQLIATKPGYGPDWIRVGDGTTEPITLKLVADDVPVTGQVTDLEGKVIPKAKVRFRNISTTATGDFSKIWETWPIDPYFALRYADKQIWNPTVAGFPEFITADAEGKFEIRGVGRGRLLGLIFEADGIENAACRVVLDPKFDPKQVKSPTGANMKGIPFQTGPDLYGPKFVHVAKPSQPIAGTVIDAQTGQPIVGAKISGRGKGIWGENGARTTVDEKGRFQLKGLVKAEVFDLSVYPAESQPYFPIQITLNGKPGLAELTTEVKLIRGVWAKGRIINKATSEPVPNAGISYTPLGNNIHYSKLLGESRELGGHVYTDPDGKFQLVVLPGTGILLAQGYTSGTFTVPYTQVRVTKEDKKFDGMTTDPRLGETFSAADGHIITLSGSSAYKIIDPKPTEESIAVELSFDPGKTVSGRIVDAENKPASAVMAYMLSACYDRPKKIRDGKFTAVALDPESPRTLLFTDAIKKQAAAVTLKGDEKDLVVQLQPYGKITGRILDSEDKPIAGVKVNAYVEALDKHQAFMMAVRDLSTTSNAKGEFILELPSGEAQYTLLLEKKGKFLNTGQANRLKEQVRPDKPISLGDLKIKGD